MDGVESALIIHTGNNYENHSQQTNRPARFSAALRLALSTTVHAENNKLVIESGAVHKAASAPLWKKSNGMTRVSAPESE